MKTIEISGEERKQLGKKETKQLRREDKVPCVLYGGEKNVHFAVKENQLKKIVFTPNVYVINLTIGKEKYQTILQDLQFHPVTDRIIHTDFFQVVDDKKVIIEIPIKLNGLAEGVKAGGKQQTVLRRLKVKAFIKDLPDTLDIDVTNVKLGEAIKVEELSFDNLELLNSPTAVVVAVKLTRAAIGGVSEEGEEETTEGTETTTEEKGTTEEKSE